MKKIILLLSVFLIISNISDAQSWKDAKPSWKDKQEENSNTNPKANTNKTKKNNTKTTSYSSSLDIIDVCLNCMSQSSAVKIEICFTSWLDKNQNKFENWLLSGEFINYGINWTVDQLCDCYFYLEGNDSKLDECASILKFIRAGYNIALNIDEEELENSMERVGEYYQKKLGEDFPNRMEAKFKDYDIEKEGMNKILNSIENSCPEVVLTFTRLASKWGDGLEDVLEDIF